MSAWIFACQLQNYSTSPNRHQFVSTFSWMTDQRNQFPIISKPAFIGEFGNDYSTNEVHLGRSKICYFHELSLKQKFVDFDLNHGFETFRPKPPSEEKLDQLLKYIIAISEPATSLRKNIHDCNIVSWRGTLTRICSSPHLSQNSDAWRIVCCKFQGVFFICELTSDAKLKFRENETELQKRQTYWGHKFEQFVTTNELDVSWISHNNFNVPHSRLLQTRANPFQHLKTIVESSNYKLPHNKATVFQYSLVEKLTPSDKTENSLSWRHSLNVLDSESFGRKRKWSGGYRFDTIQPISELFNFQSYLVGIERMVIGLRNRNGIVEKLQEVKVHDLRFVICCSSNGSVV